MKHKHAPPVESGSKAGHDTHDHHDHHAHMAGDFRKRFWISLVLTLPILALSPMLRLKSAPNPLLR